MTDTDIKGVDRLKWLLDRYGRLSLQDGMERIAFLEDEVLRLSAEVERMRGALDILKREIGEWEMDGPAGPTTVGEFIARAALGKDTP